MPRARFVPLLISVVALLLVHAAVAGAQPSTPSAAELPTPPTQPVAGPGGADYRFADVVETRYGEPPTGFWLYEPAPMPAEPLPLVVFLHGWGDMDPEAVRAWLDHLVRRGAVVVFPDYQTGTEAIPAAWDEALEDAMVHAAQGAVRAALAELRSAGRARVDPARTALVGGSWGGTMALLVAGSPAAGVPAAAAVVAVAGGCGGCAAEAVAEIQAVPQETRVLVVLGEDDEQPLVGDDPKRMFALLERVPDDLRDFVLLRSDRRGQPALRADHGLYETHVPNALDWYGTWKLTDALIACAFAGEWCEYALGNTPEQRFMGRWSDGVAVREPLVTDDPSIRSP